MFQTTLSSLLQEEAESYQMDFRHLRERCFAQEAVSPIHGGSIYCCLGPGIKLLTTSNKVLPKYGHVYSTQIHNYHILSVPYIAQLDIWNPFFLVDFTQLEFWKGWCMQRQSSVYIHFATNKIIHKIDPLISGNFFRERATALLLTTSMGKGDVITLS